MKSSSSSSIIHTYIRSIHSHNHILIISYIQFFNTIPWPKIHDWSPDSMDGVRRPWIKVRIYMVKGRRRQSALTRWILMTYSSGLGIRTFTPPTLKPYILIHTTTTHADRIVRALSCSANHWLSLNTTARCLLTIFVYGGRKLRVNK